MDDVERGEVPSGLVSRPGTAVAVDLQAQLAPPWRLGSEGRTLERLFDFPNLERLSTFVNAVLAVANLVEYPPRLWVTAGRRVAIQIAARDAAGLTEDAFELAAAVDRCGAAAARDRPPPELDDGSELKEGWVVDADEPTWLAQDRLRTLLAKVREVDEELQAIVRSLPEPEGSEDMESGARPRSLLHYVRSMVEGLLIEDLPPLLETLERAAIKTTEELERQWREGNS